MKPYPHHYRVEATAAPEGLVMLDAERLPRLESAPPVEFGGPGDRWSPETLLIGAVADCFVLTFRAVAEASQLAWTRLEAGASGTLAGAEGGARFTAVEVEARLVVPSGTDLERARRVLEKAGRGCLVTRSLACGADLVARVETAGQ